MKYISEALGVTVKYEPWNDFTGLPMYYSSNYDIRMVRLGDTPCLFIKPKGELPTVPALKKHFEVIGSKVAMPRVAILDGINSRQRKSLVNAKIPFVVDKSQLYLPFMGIVLSERFNRPKPFAEKLMPTAQVLLFHYLYLAEKKLYVSGMSDELSVSKMQITRAVEQLASLGIITPHKDGVRVFIESVEKGAALFERAKPFLLNPVRKRVYVENDELPKGLPLAGLTALSDYSMLAKPKTPVFAYYGKVADIQGTDTLIDDEQIETEIWQYNPNLLSARVGVADPLSVVVSLQNIDDPRVEQAIDEVLNGIWRSIYGQRVEQL